MARRGGSRVLAAAVLAVALLAADAPLPCFGAPGTGGLAAQDRAGDFEPPIAGSWEPIRSMGQPPRWKPFLSVGFGVDRSTEVEGVGLSGAAGIYRDLANPVYGLLGVSGEAYMGQRGLRSDPGFRALMEVPALFVHGGLDWNLRSNRRDLALGVTFSPRRGGWPLPGGQLRVDWIPTRHHSLSLSSHLPLRQPFAGRTRPRRVDVELPAPPRVSRADPPPAESGTAETLDQALDGMRWIVALHTFFWLTDVQELSHEASVRQWRERLAAFQEEMSRQEALRPGEGTYDQKADRYHRLLDRAFGLALGADPARAEAVGRPLGDLARRLTLEEVVLPYNATIGRYKKPDVLDGLVARARARFISRLSLSRGAEGAAAGELLAVLDSWLDAFEGVRGELDRRTQDSRMHWLPLALVLRPEEHRTQAQIDALVESALGRRFQGGNAVLNLTAQQFQAELRRSILETEGYHLLWIHDYRGRDSQGDPDRTAFQVTSGAYLRALLEAVRTYDEVGRFPVYMILLDQFHYEANDGRRWMTLLESPLTHETRLPDGFEWMEERIGALQDSLRSAVAQSRRLQAEAEAFGPGWITGVVKIHVNITHPSDLTFRSRRLLGPRFGADNLTRDHRKIVIRDVGEEDPGRGEVILAGVGVGDHYASPTWVDRALVLQGPAALEARDMARRVLHRNGMAEANIPPPLNPKPRGEGYWRRIRELEAAGATARVLQAHNETGWGAKEATFVQMLLYDLVPPGTVLYVPDSLWTSYPWMAQLVAAALRGCRVYVVAPALANAPSARFPQMSVMQELVTRLVLVQQEFQPMIQRAGGELRVGLFTREFPAGDHQRLLAELERALEENGFLADLFPLGSESREVVERFRRALAADAAPDAPAAVGSASSVGLPDAAGSTARAPESRRPLLHLKTQLLVSGDALARMAGAPALAGVLEHTLRAPSDTATAPASRSLLERPGTALALETLALYDTVGEGDADVLYYASGSINKNIRSMALDGEAMGLVAGPWALQAFTDFLFLSGGVTWVETVEEVEEHLPPFSSLQRRLGRWLLRVL